MESKRYERWLIRHITVSLTSPPLKSERATATYDSSHLSGRCNRQYKVVPFVDPTLCPRSPQEGKLHVVACGLWGQHHPHLFRGATTTLWWWLKYIYHHKCILFHLLLFSVMFLAFGGSTLLFLARLILLINYGGLTLLGLSNVFIDLKWILSLCF